MLPLRFLFDISESRYTRMEPMKGVEPSKIYFTRVAQVHTCYIGKALRPGIEPGIL